MWAQFLDGTNLVQLGVKHTVSDELPLLTDVKGRHYDYNQL